MHYYTHTPRSARERGLNPKRYERPLGPQALVQNYAILCYCRLGLVLRERMTREEFRERFPNHLGRGLGTNRYYIDEDGAKVRLALFLPDFDSDFRRLVRKARWEIQKRRDHKDSEVRAAFRKLLAGDNFSLTVLTALAEKAARIERALCYEPWHHRVEVVPGLAQLLMGRTNGRE
jgi:hypothetical protein